MAGYIGSKSSVTLVDGYTEAEADAEFVAITGDTMTGNLDVTGTVTSDGLTVTQTGSTTATIGATGTSGDNDGTLIISNGGSGDGMLRFDYETNTDRARIGVSSSSQNLQFYTAGNNERMRIDSTGAVTMPTQPAFQCRCATDNQNNLAINTHHTVAFSADERFDVAGNFASNTFTAPVTGKYMMAIVVYLLNLDSAANYVEVSLITSNQNYHAILETSSFASDAQYTTVPISVLVDMDFNDTAFVRVFQSAGAAQMDIANSSYFSGYLVA